MVINEKKKRKLEVHNTKKNYPKEKKKNIIRNLIYEINGSVHIQIKFINYN